MRRPAKYSQGFRWEDIKKNLSEPQLAAYGACLLAFNECEACFDALFFRACSIPMPIRDELARRVGSIEGKNELIKLSLSDINKDTTEAVAVAVSGLKDAKANRDALAHSFIYDTSFAIATVTQKGKTYDVLLSVDALNAFYEIQRILLDELMWLAAAIEAERDPPDPAPPPAALTAGQCLALALAQQKKRLDFPPLPKFPVGQPEPPAGATPVQKPGM